MGRRARSDPVLPKINEEQSLARGRSQASTTAAASAAASAAAAAAEALGMEGEG
eukprot:CAMPEP_0197635332 /NCGR_PEP_ID=MMETSP1338-20131121/11179_1 /TAXON_ID=43686 ORGANISM="Pelagodinium beii, Strain RCC1491" /NCGR_SAMPLE_ID=MMETSP1338 /ASSEMBLY_ACC=CAM_ASM_000754 /LENGTH=53 /DNA_ID=CAMNT_0043207359 /DNA_START=34 /DNA_END=192 /DNA_ORIENTATION=-